MYKNRRVPMLHRRPRFVAFYALHAGAVFLVVAGVVIAPMAHRLLHRLHLEGGDGESDDA